VKQDCNPGRFGRPVSLRGAGLLAFPFLVLLVPGCGPSGEEVPDVEVEAARVLGFPAGARLHRVTLGGRGETEHAVPTLIQARPGDGVEFRTVDHRVHTVTFPPDSLTPEVRSFLESTGQTESPPLVHRGVRFILRLQGAPPGRYPFVSEGHGGTAHGVVELGTFPGARAGGER
jgi:plastocyanin